MSSRLVLSLILAAAFITPAFAAETAPPPSPATPAPSPTIRPDSFADLADALLPAVVNISTTQTLDKNAAAEDEAQGAEGGDGSEGGDGGADNGLPQMPQFPPGSPFEEFFKDFFDHNNKGMPNGGGMAPRRATSLGSGFIFDESGLIVTNNHVIENADEIKVILHDNTKLDAEIVGKDTKTDLAVLKVKTSHKLTAVKFGNSDSARVGDWVLAIGNPFGLGGTVTAGIVSARARDINAGPYDDFIQTDASINRGNSGGPMFNMKGEVIGINTAIYSPSGGSVGIGFAIPANMAKTIIDQLKTSGSIKRGWIGVRIQNVTDDIAESVGLSKTYGALVSNVESNSPSAKAGVQAGDVITTFNGHEVSEMRRLPRMVAETPIDQSVPITVWRKGKEVKLSLKVGELSAAEATATKEEKPDDKQSKQPASTKIEALSIRVAEITPGLRQRFELTEKAKGVLVIDVDANSDAAEKGLRPGDLILEAGQTEVKTPADIEARVKATDKGKPILLLAERAGDARFIAVTVKK